MTANPKELLSHDHARLDALFAEIVDAAEADVDSRTLGELWTAFERGLLAHFNAEERYLFPRVAATHRDEIHELAREHDEIRALLSELDIAVDLHFLRAANVQQLVSRIRAHAEREDRTLYRWAQELGEPVKSALPVEDRLKRSIDF
ncbi:MAG: hemerythrin domain-containing protein [Deltaproteobacteria bacterium]|nr:hemerythrin domain-containing protein [Deltaproteobacteria bacterium]